MSSQRKPTLDDLKRLIGYLIITFLAIFLYLPFLWLINLWGFHEILYTRWVICSVVIVIFNLLFYFWRYPPNWLLNLGIAGGVDFMIMLYEYFWLNS